MRQGETPLREDNGAPWVEEFRTPKKGNHNNNEEEEEISSPDVVLSLEGKKNYRDQRGHRKLSESRQRKKSRGPSRGSWEQNRNGTGMFTGDLEGAAKRNGQRNQTRSLGKPSTEQIL